MQLHTQVLSPVPGQKEIVVRRSASSPALPATRVKTNWHPNKMDWAHDLRDDHLDTPVKHMTLKLGIVEKVDPLSLKGFTKANCPLLPKGNVRIFIFSFFPGGRCTRHGREILPHP